MKLLLIRRGGGNVYTYRIKGNRRGEPRKKGQEGESDGMVDDSLARAERSMRFLTESVWLCHNGSMIQPSEKKK